MAKLPLDYYQQDDVVELARDLLGKYLFTKINGQLSSGIIVETEAYNGRTDRACHAHLNKRTPRTSIMYEAGGRAYVYLCYGIHNLFNIVTNQKDKADAVLIRAVEPVDGLDLMLERRNKSKLDKRLTAGPGSLSKALGINRSHYGELLNDSTIWLEDKNLHYSSNEIVETTRIGVDYAREDALLPWRFYVKDNPYISKK